MPDDEEVGRHQEHVRHDPGEGVGKAGGDVAENRYQHQACNAPGEHLHDTGADGHFAVAHALDQQPENIHRGQGHKAGGVDNHK